MRNLLAPSCRQAVNVPIDFYNIKCTVLFLFLVLVYNTCQYERKVVELSFDFQF